MLVKLVELFPNTQLEIQLTSTVPDEDTDSDRNVEVS